MSLKLKTFIQKWFDFLNFRFRLTLIFALIFGATTIIFNLGVFSYVIEALRRDFDDALYNYCVDISDSIEEKIIKGQYDVTPIQIEHGKILPFSLGTSLILLRHRDSRILAQFGNFGDFTPPLSTEIEKIDQGADASYKTIHNLKNLPDPEADSYRLITIPIENKNPQFFLQVIVPRTLLETQINNRLLVVQFGIPLLLIFSMVIGYYLSGKSLIPVKNIIKATQKINANILSGRVPVPSARDEFKVLALTMNQMLERIEKAFLSQEKFVADASHQLLSPLTILKSSIEHFIKNPNQQIDLKSFLENQQIEIDSLTQIIQDMLLLARMDAGLATFQFSQVHMEDTLLDVITALDKKAKEKNIRIIFNINNNENIIQSPSIFAEPDLLKHLFHNIIENAIKYSPAQQSIEIEIERSKNISTVNIMDRGPGIPLNQIDYIFERFSRAPETSKTNGYGLGLAIAKKIANLHEAKLQVKNRASGGCIFQFEIKNI